MANGGAYAIDNAARVSEIGFPEFTSKLVTDVFDALIGANIRQTAAYISLVKSVAQSLAAFIAATEANLGDAEVDGLLAPFPDVKLSGSLTQAKADAVNARLETPAAANVPSNNRAATAGSITQTRLDGLRAAARKKLAAERYTILQDLVKQGILRLVVDSGEIETRLTFTTYSSSVDASSSSTTSRGIGAGAGGGSSTSVGSNAGVTRSSDPLAGLLGGAQSILGSFASGFSGSANANANVALTVSTAKESHRDVSGSRVQVFGRVKLRFKTDYVPLNQ